jgi:signal transduction histidine kinase/CheY-like chemotaxis protein
MSMPSPSLKEFAQTTPVCEQTSGLADVLEIFRSSGCDEIVVVSPQQFPLGVVNLSKVMPYLIPVRQLGNTPLAIVAKNSDNPLFELNPSIIDPLVIVPAQLSLNQFWPYLQASRASWMGNWNCWQEGENRTVGQWESDRELEPHSIAPSGRQHWALVDEQGKFLGLLNSWLILQSLAPNLAKSREFDVDEQHQSMTLKPLVRLLEHLPLPLSIQTTTGQVLAQNLTWRQQIGTAPDLDWVRRTTAEMLDFPGSEPRSTGSRLSVPASGTGLRNEVAQTPCESLLSVPNVVKERCKTSAPGIIQYFCAIDTPRLATSVSTQQVIVSAPAMGRTQEPTTDWEASTPIVETAKRSQERVFSFVKIPLSPSVFEPGNLHEWEKESDFSASPYHPSICDLCVVLAQDTTEQQQVAKELAAKNADLVQLNRLKDEFLACISHELKTPLTAVLGLSTLLKDRALGELNERQARYARLIYQSGRQLMTLVNDILDLTRMETGQLELTLEPVQIQSVCDRAYSQAGQLQHDKDQEEESTTATKFTLEIEPGLEMLVADELRLRQMLAHLLSNALKFTDADAEMGLRVNRWEGWIAFTVWDNGIGIPPEKQHLIFQKFQQLEQPLTRRFEGTGLGLVLTQRLARLHGGDISFISKSGEGSEFTLLLPPCPPQVKRTDGEIPQCPIPNPQCPIRNRLVLIVETVPRYLDSLTEQLESLGYRVVIARSGTEAIEKARGLQPRVILLNPLLPQLSGWDVLTLLKSDAQTCHIPVLVTATQAEKQQAYQHKADGFLSLPVQKQALLQNLTDLDEQETPTISKGKGLTILHLSPVETCPHTCVHSHTSSDSSLVSSELTDLLSLQHSELNYRVLEADDLDQAELLARVWHPDVLLLDAANVVDPLAYLEQFALHPELISIPLVTLDRQTTEVANQVPGLSVYPCLATDNSAKMTALLQVIQVAAGMSHMPSIVVMDIGEQELTNAQEYSPSKISASPGSREKNVSLSSPRSQAGVSEQDVRCDRTSVRRSRGARSAVGKAKKSSIAAPVNPQSSWLQALMQYLQTAGFRSVLSCSWTELYCQLQEQSVDLLLIRLKDSTDSSTLVKELVSIAQLPNLPPILVLDHRLHADTKGLPIPGVSQGNVAVMGGDESTSNLDSLLKAVATQFLRGHSLPMSQLLDQINHALGM